MAPIWLACLASLALAASVGGRLLYVVIPVYALGAIALGALSMGHEFSGGTLTLLLSQPRRRAHVFLVKAAVLALMLQTLAAVAWVTLPASFGARFPQLLGLDGAYSQVFVVMLPPLCGLFIAPCLTLLCRSPLAGVVFSVATPGVLLLIGQLFASTYANDPATASDPRVVQIAVLWRGMLGVSAIAAIFSWRLFLRLEATDDRALALPMPWQRLRSATVAARPASAKRHPLWLLTKKELRLQHLSFVVGALYVIGWFGFWSVRWRNPDVAASLLFALTASHIGAISLLAGSLASAEERQLGTSEWHTLLPMSARTQWTVKAGTALGVAVVVGLGVPMLLSSLARWSGIHVDVPSPLQGQVGFVVIGLTVVSLYVSSLCTSGLRALIWSLLAALGVLTLASRVLTFQLRVGPLLDFNYARLLRDFDTRLFVLVMTLNVLFFAMYAGGIGLLLRFARVNHRSAERGARRIWNQMLRLGAFLALVVSLWFGVSQIYRADMIESRRVWMQQRGTLTGGVVDGAHRPVTRCTIVVIPEDENRMARDSFSFLVDERLPFTRQGTFEVHVRPGRYSVLAVESLGNVSIRDPQSLARLKAHAFSVTVAAGESRTLALMLSKD